MNPQNAQLASRIEREIPELDRVVRVAQRTWDHAYQVAEDQEVYAGYSALSLHSFYNGLEAIFELIAATVDLHQPSGDAWHMDLLEQMARSAEGVRPSVIGPDSARQLKDFLRFRHVIRNIYVTNLDASRMKAMFHVLPDLWMRLQADLAAFAAFLRS